MSFIFEFTRDLISKSMEDPVKRREARATYLRNLQVQCDQLCVSRRSHRTARSTRSVRLPSFAPAHVFFPLSIARATAMRSRRPLRCARRSKQKELLRAPPGHQP
jgi:hypothetical protein